MGRLGQILGVGIKGQLWLELERTTYHAGDTVQGAVRLSVTEEFRCNGGLMLEINGVETIAWTQHVGKRGSWDRDRRSTFLQQEQQISGSHETFSPGEYVYPFTYRLHSKLPGSFHFFTEGIGNAWDNMYDIHVHIKYHIKARLAVQGTFTSNLEGKQGFVVIPNLPVREIHPLGRSKNEEVRMMAIAGKGNCRLSVSMDHDVYSPGESITMLCSVANQSEMNTRKVSVRLYEDVVLYKWICDAHRSTCVNEVMLPPVPVGESMDRMVTIGPPVQAIRPPTTSQFIQWSYRIEVRCAFLLSPSVKLQIPVTMVHHEALDRLAAGQMHNEYS